MRRLNITDGGWVKYGGVDEYGRPKIAEACLSPQLIHAVPHERPHNMRCAKVVGWDKITDKDIFQRCHLLGYRLVGVHSDTFVYQYKDILFIGTRHLNQTLMYERYEKPIKEYVLSSEKLVTYSVTPIYEGDEILPRKVHLIAKSEDGEIDFDELLPNEYPGHIIDYKTGACEECE